MARSFLLLLFVTIAWYGSKAQKPLTNHYTVNDGLASNNVYSAFQDSKGFIWLCTDLGVSRFDGHHFETLTSDDGLPDNEVFFMHEDAWSRCWLLTLNGVPSFIRDGRVFSPRNDKLCQLIEERGLNYGDVFWRSDKEIRLTGKQNYILKGNKITLSKHQVAFPYPGYQFHYRGREYLVDRQRLLRLDDSASTTIVTVRDGGTKATLFIDGHLFVSVENGKFTEPAMKIFLDIDLTGGEIKIKDVTTPFRILRFARGKYGRLWCCTDQGIYAYDPSKDHLSKQQSVAMDGICTYSCLADKQGNYWYATNNGLYMDAMDSAVVYSHASGLAKDEVRSIACMPDGKLLAGYENGNVDIIDHGKVSPFVVSKMQYWNRVVYLAPVSNNLFFAGTDWGLFKVNIKDGTSIPIYPFAQKWGTVKNNLLLFGTNGGPHSGGAIYDLIKGELHHLPDSPAIKVVTATAIGANNIYWLGTLKGLYYWRGNAIYKQGADSALSDSRITSLNIMVGNRLIIGTHSSGIFILDSTGLCHLHKGNGLVSDICKKVYVDEKQRAWINTDKGLERISFSGGINPEIYHFPTSGGVKGYRINDIAFGGGKIYLATSDGIITVNQDHISNVVPYRVYILTASFKNKVINYPERIVLNYNENNAQITYTGISYAGGGYITYRYLLRGSGSDTIKTTAGTLNLEGLRPGSYQLMVWAAGKNNDWNKIPAVLDIMVKPPLWTEAWFMICVGSILAISVVFFYKHRISKVKQKEEEKAERKRTIAELEMQALRAQINPHFMFNALNAIQNFYNQNDELSANYYMSSFARLIRQTLTYSKEHWIVIAEEMSMLKTYIELEQMRFKHKFTYTINMEPSVERYLMPTMILQTYTENAINHGLRNLDKEGCLEISCYSRDSSLVFSVTDNGVGFEKARKLASRPGDHKSMGMKITESRIATLNQLYNAFISVEIIDRASQDPDEEGTMIQITMKKLSTL